MSEEHNKELNITDGIQLATFGIFAIFFVVFIYALSSNQTTKIDNILICMVAPFVIFVTTTILKKIPSKDN